MERYAAGVPQAQILTEGHEGLDVQNLGILSQPLTIKIKLENGVII